MARTSLLRLPETAADAAALNVELLARNYLIVKSERTPYGYREETVIIAGLLQLLNSHRDRADRHAEEIAMDAARELASAIAWSRSIDILDGE
jgi:hypothetical protein